MPGSIHLVSSAKSFAGRKHDTTDGIAANVLRDLHRPFLVSHHNAERFIYFRQVAAVKFHINDRAGYPHYDACLLHIVSSLSMRDCHPPGSE